MGRHYLNQAILAIILGFGMFGLGMYAAVKFGDWKRPVAIVVAVIGALLLIGAALGLVDLIRRAGSML